MSASHPSRVRGLKYTEAYRFVIVSNVAPFTGAWIEITFLLADIPDIAVAPFTGAWIEMSTKPIQGYTEPMSHPSRVRGLKCASFIAVHSLM